MKPPSSQHDTQPFKSRPFIAPTAPPRPHLRHTPRPDSELLEPPAEGSAWTWNPEIVNADGANAAPNAVRNACQEENSEHSILRGHCSVHQQRLIQQNKYQIFTGVDRAEAMQMAEQLSAWMESVKCHSTSDATAHPGKVMLQHHLHSLPEHKGEIASKYFAEHLSTQTEFVETHRGLPDVRAPLGRPSQLGLRCFRQHCIDTFLRDLCVSFHDLPLVQCSLPALGFALFALAVVWKSANGHGSARAFRAIIRKVAAAIAAVIAIAALFTGSLRRL